MENKPALGVSACLLGHAVRFDGGHKWQRFISEILARHFELQPVCPEVDLGLAVPRPAIQLRRDPVSGAVRLINPRQAGRDLTGNIQDYAASRVAGLGKLAGYIFKKGSPSCGMERVPVVINDSGHRLKEGVGLFAQTFMARWPLVPVEEERCLNDPAIRENFFERVFALQRWREIEEPARNLSGFIDFHTHHKLLLMARGTTYYRELGQLVAGTT
jgi:uncharacterized protein YbbK (DUF523 family)